MRRSSGLALPVCLLHANGDFHRFAAATITHAADRRGTQIIQTDGDTHVRIGSRNAVGGIESNPPEVLDVRFGPGMSRFLLSRPVRSAEVSADIAGRNAGTSGD